LKRTPTTGESDVLQQLNRKTQTDVLMPQMLSGKVQGQFLKFISQMVQPERVLEIGTFTGYAAICLAEGLTENGKLITIDINEELEDIVKTHVLKKLVCSIQDHSDNWQCRSGNSTTR
jgi:caffeoyl-CoA O-methyltransferase